MPNAYTTNYSLFAANEQFSAIWKLTRTMMAAGWRYKGSGNGQSSGSWNTAQTGTTVNATSFTTPAVTLTGLQGMSPGVVGQWITLAGFTGGNTGNNGTWLILSYISSSSVTVYNTGGTGAGSGTSWSLVRDAALDLWGVDGNINLTAVPSGGTSAGAVVIAAASASTGQATITGVTGFSQNASPGRVAVITGSTLGNNGNFRIISSNAAGTSVVVYAPQLVAESGNGSLAVSEQYGGAGASITTFSSTTSGQSTLIQITGLSGLTSGASSPDIGRKIRFLNPASPANMGSFTIVSVSSTSACTVYNPFAVQTDGNNGSIQWVEWDPLQQTYPSYLSGASGQGAWHLLQGPTVMKIPIGTNLPTGTFIRGENVTQTTTGAQGELMGIVTDSSGGTGYLVIAPRVIGTGVQAGSATDLNMTYGWNNSANTDTVTGAISGATVTTPISSTPIAYIRETQFWKNNASTGHCYHQCIDQNPSGTEAVTSSTTGRFSIMAGTLSQISAQAPAGSSNSTSPLTNGFPTTDQGAGSWVGTYVPLGSGGSAAGGSAGTGSLQWATGTPTSPGRAQILCANNIEQQLVSADGSWGYYQSCNSTGYQTFAYYRCDNQEDGDIDPYVHMGMWGGAANGSPDRDAQTSNAGSGTDNCNTGQTWFNSGGGGHPFAGFRRRGLTSENYSWFSGAFLYDPGLANFILIGNSGNPDQVATAVTTTYVREPIWVYLTGYTAQNSGVRMRKGTPRWLFLCQGGSTNATFDTKQWLVLSSSSAMFVAGPYDGATTPSF